MSHGDKRLSQSFYRVRLPIPEPAADRPARDRLMLAMRPLWPALRRCQAVLRPGTRARAWSVRQTFPAGYAAVNRQDLVLVESYYRRDAEVRADPEAVMQLGLKAVYIGRGAMRELSEGWNEAFASWRWEMPLLIDGGDRWVALGEIVTIGASSEIEVGRRIAAATRLRGGQIAHQNFFWEWEDALAVFGLPAPEEIPWAEGQGP
ncbi:MAG: hypothetical protein QOG62_2246 [Thermoleophilaceae bacterium]|jgi:hypothetical protein|nr:hypothetical protein [Thermoleophilaceae bacterium]